MMHTPPAWRTEPPIYVTCKTCGHVWDETYDLLCPRCQYGTWTPPKEEPSDDA